MLQCLYTEVMSLISDMSQHCTVWARYLQTLERGKHDLDFSGTLTVQDLAASTSTWLFYIHVNLLTYYKTFKCSKYFKRIKLDIQTAVAT